MKLIFTMSDNTSTANNMADEYLLEMPKIVIPDNSPEWVMEFFPTLIKSICDTFNGKLKKLVSNYNDSFVDLQKQIDDMSNTSKVADKAVVDLKSQLSERDHIIAEQHSNISKLQMSIDRNESYSRRSNLIFGGISKDAKGSCTNIVQNIMSNTMNIPQAETITFVKCHYLNQPTNDKKGSIIARFENFSTRMNVWSKRKSLLSTEYYLSEDYPKEISRKRGKLRPILKEASKHRDYARCISIKYDQLNFKGELMNFDDLHKLPGPINPRSLSERRSRDMLCFGGVLSEYHELSNFFNSEFEYKNINFKSVEQGFQYSKAMLFGDDRTASLILHSKSPSESKHLGQHVNKFDVARWNQGRDSLMKALVLSKFSQNAQLKKILCDTGTMHLAEATKGDAHFGTGVALSSPSCLQRSSWKGRNKLGEALMEARRELQEKK